MLVIKSGEKIPEPEIIPTPSKRLNHVLGGGLKTNSFHTIWGTPQAGKSTILLKTLSTAVDMGYEPVIIDTEHSITDEWLMHCGLTPEHRTYIQGNQAEDIYKTIVPMMKEDGVKRAFLIDSINNVISEDFYKKDDSSGGLALPARTQTELIQKLVNFLTTDNIVLIIAQQYNDISANGKLSGKFGNALHHNSNNVIKLFASSARDNLERNEDNTITKRLVTWTIEKSKQGPLEGTKGEYWFDPVTTEIDSVEEIIDLAGSYGIISQTPGWYEFNGKKMRKAELVEVLSTDEDQINKIFDTVESMNA